MRPNVELARNAGIETGETGGIRTDCSLHVKKGRGYISNVYALGDCVEVIDFITHRPKLSQLASTAMVQSKVVADNMFGISSSFEPCLSPTVAVISGLQVGAVGIISEIANRYGIKVIIGKSSGVTRARYYPGAKPITVKFLFDAVCERLIGAQMVSEESVPQRVNDYFMAIKRGMTIKDLANTERCYDPSVAFSEDITIRAAEAAKKQA